MEVLDRFVSVSAGLRAAPYLLFSSLVGLWFLLIQRGPVNDRTLSGLYEAIGVDAVGPIGLSVVRVISHIDMMHMVLNLWAFLPLALVLMAFLTAYENWVLVGIVLIGNGMSYLVWFPEIIGFSWFVSALFGVVLVVLIGFRDQYIDNWIDTVLLIGVVLFVIGTFHADILVALGFMEPPAVDEISHYTKTTSEVHVTGLAFGLIVGVGLWLSHMIKSV